jgi:hypothetical protein
MVNNPKRQSENQNNNGGNSERRRTDPQATDPDSADPQRAAAAAVLNREWADLGSSCKGERTKLENLEKLERMGLKSSEKLEDKATCAILFSIDANLYPPLSRRVRF